MISWSALSRAIFETRIFELLKAAEGLWYKAYVDDKGFVTIGVGLNIESNETLRNEVYKSLGLNISAGSSDRFYIDGNAQFRGLDDIITDSKWNNYTQNQGETYKDFVARRNTDLQNELDAVMQHRATANSGAGYRTEFKLTGANPGEQNEPLTLLTLAWQTFEQEVNNYLQAYLASGTTTPDSFEKVVLLSFAYNGGKVDWLLDGQTLPNGKPAKSSLLEQSMSLLAAIGNDDRPEAWYQIAYNSNGDRLAGIAWRRLLEGKEFGLYENHDPTQKTGGVGASYNSPANEAEALKVMRMWTKHKDHILKVQNTDYPNSVAAAQTHDSATESVEFMIKPAKSFLIQKAIADLGRDFVNYASGITNIEVYVDHSTRTPAAIQKDVNQNGGTYAAKYIASEKNELFGTNDSNDVIFGLSNADKLYGRDGNDVLYGGIGDDTLYGENGDDALFGEAGDDTIYGGAGSDYMDGGDGDDSFIINASDLINGGFDEIKGGSHIAGDKIILKDDGNLGLSYFVTTNAAMEGVINVSGYPQAGLVFSGIEDLVADWAQSNKTNTLTITGNLTGILSPNTIYVYGGDHGNIVDASGLTSVHHIDFQVGDGDDMYLTSGLMSEYFVGGLGADTLVLPGITESFFYGGFDGDEDRVVYTQAAATGEDGIQVLGIREQNDYYIQRLGTSSVRDEMNDVEIIEGSRGDDLMQGRGAKDHFVGGEGDDILFGDPALGDVANWSFKEGTSGWDFFKVRNKQDLHFNNPLPDSYFTTNVSWIQGNDDNNALFGLTQDDWTAIQAVEIPEALIPLVDAGGLTVYYRYWMWSDGDELDYTREEDDGRGFVGGLANSNYSSVIGGYNYSWWTGGTESAANGGAHHGRPFAWNFLTLPVGSRYVAFGLQTDYEGGSGNSTAFDMAEIGFGYDISGSYYLLSSDDVLDGGPGADTLFGGGGSDTFVFSDEWGQDILGDFEEGIDHLIFDTDVTVSDAGAVAASASAPGGGDLLGGVFGSLLGLLGPQNAEAQTASGTTTVLVSDGTNTVTIYGTSVEAVQAAILMLGADGLAVIDGTEDDDVITGTGIGDKIHGYGGNDEIHGDRGDDTLYGDEGDDVLYGEDGSDTLVAGAGNDELYGGKGRDTYELATNDGDTAFVSETGSTADEVDALFLSGITDMRELGYLMVAKILLGSETQAKSGEMTLPSGGVVQVEKLFDEAAGDERIEYLQINDAEQSKLLMQPAGTGTDENDMFFAASGDQSYDGGAGNDWFFGGSGPSGDGSGITMDGGEGDDIFVIRDADDEVTGGNGTDKVLTFISYTLSLGVENLTALGIDNIDLTGTSETNEITGNDGDNLIDGAGGQNDVLAGEKGDDTYIVRDGSEQIIENADEGTDAIRTQISLEQGMMSDNVENLSLEGSAEYAHANDMDNIIQGNDLDNEIYAYGGDDTIYAEDGDDIIYGGDGVDKIYGDLGADTLYGDAGADELYGSFDADTLYGGAGDDLLRGGEDNDLLFGEDGSDMLEGGVGDDDLRGAAGNDKLYGEDGNDLLYGGAGTDELDGGAGNDELYGGDDADILSGGDGADKLYGEAGDDTVYGGSGNDELYGADGNDVLSGDAGDDLISGGAGNDTLTGGDGNDTLYGRDDDDTLYGNAGDDLLFGGAGADRLYGGAGNDHILGDTDDIDLFGGSGEDLYELTNTGSGNVLVSEAGGGAGEDDTLRLNDVTSEEEFAYTLISGQGSDGTLHLQDGGSVTIADLFNAPADATRLEWLELGTGGSLMRLLMQAQNVGTTANEVFFAATGFSSYWGGAGNDWFFGNDGITGDGAFISMTGGTGDDTFVIRDGDDLVFGGVGMDTVYSFANYTLSIGTEILRALGTDDLSLIGNSDINWIYGNSGNNLLDGAGGVNDYLEGGAGDDTYLYRDGSEIIVEQENGGIDTIRAQIDMLEGKMADHVENLILEGMARKGHGNTLDNEIHGNMLDNELYGHEGDDILFGHRGDDKLYGSWGDDTLHGGAGDDLLFGGAGNDTASYEDAGNGVTVLLGQGLAFGSLLDGNLFTLPFAVGTDQLDSIENVTGSQYNDEITGDDGNNRLDGGYGDDLIFGGNGNDILFGGSGNDVIWGGTGVGGDSSFDRFMFQQNGGRDTIKDFENGIDKIDLTGFGSSLTYDDLSIAKGNSGFVEITYDDTVFVMQGYTDTDEFTADDFIF